MRGFSNLLSGFVFNVREDLREFACRHFHNGLGGSLSGVYVRVPFTRLSAFIEWRDVNVGYGQERSSKTDWEFFLGRVQGVFSIEPRHSTANL